MQTCSPDKAACFLSSKGEYYGYRTGSIYFADHGGVILLPGGFFWYLLHLAKDPKNLEETRGELLWFRVEKNVHGRRGYRDIVIKRLIRYTYRYTVNGRTHKLRGQMVDPTGRPRAGGRIVYLRGFPSLAYLDSFTGQRELVWALVLTGEGIIVLLISLFLLLIL